MTLVRGMSLFAAVCLLSTGLMCSPTDQVLSSPGGTPSDDATGTTDTGGTTDSGTTDDGTGGLALTGRLAIKPPASTRFVAGREVAAVAGSEVVAISQDTKEVYRGTVGADGTFDIPLPEDEKGHSMVVTIVGPDGKPLGPVVFDSAGSNGTTGVKPDGEADLGTVEIPSNLGAGAILAGDDGNIEADNLDATTKTRLDGNGAPVGVGSFGKGSGALASGPKGSGIDADQDGLPDLFDADDNGDGTVDDFEAGASSWALGKPGDVRPNFFMNLKVPVENSAVYYSGTADQIADALSTGTVITMEVLSEPGSKKKMTGVKLLTSPAPSYVPLMTLGANGGPLWSTTGYQFTFNGDRYEAFTIPHAVMSPGDTFSVEVSFEDGTTQTYSRMLNFIFKRIPRLIEYGTAGSTVAFDPNDPNQNGTFQKPIIFDGTQDLVLEFQPPQDEDGNLLTKLDYQMEMFYYDANGFPVNNIDRAAAFPTPVPNLDPNRTVLNVPASQLTLTADNTYVFTFPKEVFLSTAPLQGGGTSAVGLYKIDVAAQCPSGNTALMFMLKKQ